MGVEGGTDLCRDEALGKIPVCFENRIRQDWSLVGDVSGSLQVWTSSYGARPGGLEWQFSAGVAWEMAAVSGWFVSTRNAVGCIGLRGDLLRQLLMVSEAGSLLRNASFSIPRRRCRTLMPVAMIPGSAVSTVSANVPEGRLCRCIR